MAALAHASEAKHAGKTEAQISTGLGMRAKVLYFDGTGMCLFSEVQRHFGRDQASEVDVTPSMRRTGRAGEPGWLSLA